MHAELTQRAPGAAMGLRIALFVTAALLIGAHFLRAGNVPVLALCLAAPVLFLHRRRWALLTLQGLAYAASATWVVTLLDIVGQRRLVGQPWTVAALILAAVALFTFLAGALLNARSVRERYPP